MADSLAVKDGGQGKSYQFGNASMELFVSVIVPTFNRCRLLRETIESLWNQTLPPICYEILVIDNLSTDGTQEMVEELQRQSPCPLVYHRM